MRYVIGVVGAIVMFILTTLLVGVFMSIFRPLASIPIPLGLITINAGAVISLSCGIFAAVSSYRASIRRYETKKAVVASEVEE